MDHHCIGKKCVICMLEDDNRKLRRKVRWLRSLITYAHSLLNEAKVDGYRKHEWMKDKEDWVSMTKRGMEDD